jgi:methyl-accepting chemotaxis protein
MNASESATGGGEIQMNIDDAVKAHTMWKMKLAQYISNPDRSLNATVVGSSNECALGKWINGEGKQHSKCPEFPAMVSGHVRFHKAAGDVIRKADAGLNVEEEIALGGKSEFAAASSAVVMALMKLKSKL